MESVEVENRKDIEIAWAEKAFRYADTHFNLLRKRGSGLNLTKHDDTIYDKFRERFPDFSIGQIEVDMLKSENNKVIWREFIEENKDLFNDFNFGTLLRLNSCGKYEEENTILVVRAQFLAIEIARNKERHNDNIK